mmetsp:Transcript_73109/g.136656  ORF Transcript_73109/g.136656 Transcript_73109/m.136656 type:complete len:208 (+) Transcript_73109:520-1143(+)
MLPWQPLRQRQNEVRRAAGLEHTPNGAEPRKLSHDRCMRNSPARTFPTPLRSPLVERPDCWLAAYLVPFSASPSHRETCQQARYLCVRSAPLQPRLARLCHPIEPRSAKQDASLTVSLVNAHFEPLQQQPREPVDKANLWEALQLASSRVQHPLHQNVPSDPARLSSPQTQPSHHLSPSPQSPGRGRSLALCAVVQAFQQPLLCKRP